MASKKKTEPNIACMSVRMPQELYTLIEKAAKLSGLQVSTYARDRLLTAARRDLRGK